MGLLKRGNAIGEEIEATWILPTGTALLAHAHALAGRVEQALPLLGRVLSAYRKLPTASK